jgi:hypothetical protein
MGQPELAPAARCNGRADFLIAARRPALRCGGGWVIRAAFVIHPGEGFFV